MLVVKNVSANARVLRDVGSILGLGRSPGGRHGNTIQYSCLKNPMDRGTRQVMVHRITQSWIWLKWLTRHAHSAYKLNKHGHNVQPFPILNHSVVPCKVLTVDSWFTHKFLRRQVRWSGIPISLRNLNFVVMHIVKGFRTVNEVEVGVFLELPCFFSDSKNVGNLISGFFAFSKTSLYIWSSQFTYCWSLAWRTLSITLLACEMNHSLVMAKGLA